MFTGLIQKTGSIVDLQRTDGSGHVVVDTSPWERSLELGESISVQGVCLTLTHHSADTAGMVRLAFDVLDETFKRTTLADRQVGDLVNLERALRMGDPLGGHIVNGHIDGCGTLAGIVESGQDRIITIECDDQLMSGIMEKGSVAVDGISLTVAKLGDGWFTVHIIPHTWEHTALRQLAKGSNVNLEIDIIAKYVQRYTTKDRLEKAVSWASLKDAGLIE